MRHDEIEILRLRDHFGERGFVRRRIDQLGVLHQRRGLGEPGGIPERFDLALGLGSANRRPPSKPSKEGAWRKRVLSITKPQIARNRHWTAYRTVRRANGWRNRTGEPRKTTNEIVSRNGRSQIEPALAPTRRSIRHLRTARATNAAASTVSEAGLNPSSNAAMKASGSAWIAPEPTWPEGLMLRMVRFQRSSMADQFAETFFRTDVIDHDGRQREAIALVAHRAADFIIIGEETGEGLGSRRSPPAFGA